MSHPSIIAIPMNGVQIEARLVSEQEVDGERMAKYVADNGDVFLVGRNGKLKMIPKLGEDLDAKFAEKMKRGPNHQSAGIHTGEPRKG